jgi:hypothetical protein
MERRDYSHEEHVQLLKHLVEFRLLLENPMASVDVQVLQPLCEGCAYHVYGERPEGNINRFLTFTHDAVAFYPNDRFAGMFRLYHQPSHQLMRWPKKKRIDPLIMLIASIVATWPMEMTTQYSL